MFLADISIRIDMTFIGVGEELARLFLYTGAMTTHQTWSTPAVADIVINEWGEVRIKAKM